MSGTDRYEPTPGFAGLVAFELCLQGGGTEICADFQLDYLNSECDQYVFDIPDNVAPADLTINFPTFDETITWSEMDYTGGPPTCKVEEYLVKVTDNNNLVTERAYVKSGHSWSEEIRSNDAGNFGQLLEYVPERREVKFDQSMFTGAASLYTGNWKVEIQGGQTGNLNS